MSAKPISPDEIAFDEATHTYRVRGDVWPHNVTSVLGPFLADFSAVDPEVLRRARDFGTAVHRMIELYEQDDLDEGSLAPELATILGHYQRAVREMNWSVAECELPVAHSLHRYVGKLDLVCYAGDRKTADLIDIKTGVVPLTAGPQTAAYAEAYKAMPMNPWHRIGRRFCLSLSTEGYKLHPLTEASDFSVFLSCLNLIRFQEKHR